MKKTVKAAGIQLAPSFNRRETLLRTEHLIRLAVEKGAKLVCLPQLFALRWFPSKIDNEGFSLAEPEDGPTVTFLRELAQKEGAVVIAPVFEKDGGDYFNTAFVVGDDGGIIGRYRKMHVPQIPLWEEKTYFKPGDLGFPVFKTRFGTIGVQLCWDVFFPEGMRILALKGAEIVFAPTASAFSHSHLKWERAIAASAHANGLFIFRVNRVGVEGRQEFYGRSFCVGPDGEYIVKPAGPSEGIILAEMDLAGINAVRNVWVFLKDRRPDNYKEIAEEPR
ncbi:MAG: hypothetical protein HY883_02080 [Deltaproteobacteria bacterium]|nr:hypothetical protein [Deltaproteobacteria bacterium]